MTLSDDRPSRVRTQQKASEPEKLESRKKLPNNRTKAQPVGTTAKPRTSTPERATTARAGGRARKAA